MSIGNTKEYGNKGNNFPFQLKVLQGLTNVITAISGVTINIDPETKVTNITRPVTSGTVPLGANNVSIANVGTTNATVKGVVLKPGEIITFNAGALNNTLDAIAYTASATAELLIITVV